MKKIFSIILALTLALSLAACGGGNDKPSNDAPLTREDGGAQQQTDGRTKDSFH
mgnify:CR=1 FL=1